MVAFRGPGQRGGSFLLSSSAQGEVSSCFGPGGARSASPGIG